jgi:UDP-glucose 4-epimerase
MNLLVTGATGFIGSHLCRELVRKGHNVFALSRTGRTRNVVPLMRRKEFHLIKGDIQDAGMMQALVKENRIKAIFHLAAQLPGENDNDDPFACFDTNARGTLNILNAAAKNGVERFIYASTMSVYAEPPRYLPVDEDHPTQPSTVYGVGKLAGELLCNTYSNTMKITILRYGGTYGRGERESDAVQMFIKQAKQNRPMTIYGDGKQTTDFVRVEDAVAGTLLAWEKGQAGIYNIGSGEETSVKTLAEEIIKITKSKSEITLTDKATDRPFRFYLDIKKAKKDLGYSPRPLAEGLRGYLKELNDEE